ncbi:hypothetical protein GCM10025868_06920 [Angustibacter aerolatus]|uniref:Uncharacterized protein n=1 Tax=Angustibacter aerolatus TaxID=1162965 RepID=A0ABQ6JEV9_9ACTN|nr:hypothetical protein [Angustibacter aerolatus]GMA85442.1 hypothetical protein GCM10025868_06920 [Angustibacter aerolatus]
MRALALTDRDGLYGSVKFVLACQAAGVAPLLGVDLATAPTGLVAGLPAWADPSVSARAATRSTPARGGAPVDLRHPRVTVLALGSVGPGGTDGAAPRRAPGGRRCAGWCRTRTSAATTSAVAGGAGHRPERRRPVRVGRRDRCDGR